MASWNESERSSITRTRCASMAATHDTAAIVCAKQTQVAISVRFAGTARRSGCRRWCRRGNGDGGGMLSTFAVITATSQHQDRQEESYMDQSRGIHVADSAILGHQDSVPSSLLPNASASQAATTTRCFRLGRSALWSRSCACLCSARVLTVKPLMHSTRTRPYEFCEKLPKSAFSR